MRQSQLFTKTRKEAPKDEVSKNAILLTRAGFIHKEMAGVYSYLPLGLRVLKKIENIIREEMNAVGGQEILMPALQIKERYEATNRWDDKEVDNWFKTKLANGTELGLGFSHEENLSPIMKSHLNSYRDFPVAVYQIQNKFRNELRSKSGIMRGREFLMKDMYSYSLSQAQHDGYYEKVKQAYFRIFEKLGLGNKTFLTFASGGSFSKFSHEFQTLSEAGEDTIYLNREKGLAVNKEVLTDEVLKEIELKRGELEEVKAIEVGNIFSLGTKFSEPFGIKVTDENGEETIPIMGCYGIGIGRAMGTVVEVLSDEKGIIWPKEVSPFQIHLLLLASEAKDMADEMYKTLVSQGIEVLYDDRDLRAGEKFADADLIGIPTRVIVGEKTLASKMLEVKDRATGKTRETTLDELVKEFTPSTALGIKT
ncbi:MAG: aminoacyl--tRNA ligase-related protein [bacterium]|nr:aminoacyl--tRNA ligase-related protein [bacterium]